MEPVDLRPGTLLDAARRQTGLSRFLDSYDFETPLRVMIDSYEQEAELSLLGRAAVRNVLLQFLTAQLEIQREFEEHPEILDTEMAAPIFILGFPRTGTTLLHNLMGAATHARALKLWELERPAPAITPQTPEVNPRFKATARQWEMSHRILPHLRAIHPFDAQMPEECIILLRKLFTCISFSFAGSTPSYTEWFMKQDLVPAYRELKKMYQLLLWKFPGFYPVLKSPAHAFAVDAIVEVFPDARIVQTHREIEAVAASACSLVEVFHTLHLAEPDPQAIGRDWLRVWSEAIRRTDASRKKLDPSRVFDVPYHRFVADPAAMVQQIYDNFGMECSADTAQRGQAWLGNNPQHKHGVHDYDLARYGLGADELRQNFAGYIAWAPVDEGRA